MLALKSVHALMTIKMWWPWICHYWDSPVAEDNYLRQLRYLDIEKMTEPQPSFFQDVHNIFHEGKSVQIAVVASIVIAIVIFIIIIIDLLYLLTTCISSRMEKTTQSDIVKQNAQQTDRYWNGCIWQIASSWYATYISIERWWVLCDTYHTYSQETILSLIAEDWQHLKGTSKRMRRSTLTQTFYTINSGISRKNKQHTYTYTQLLNSGTNKWENGGHQTKIT